MNDATYATPLRDVSDRAFWVFCAVVSVVALSGLGWLLLIHGGGGAEGVDIRFMPGVNATFNALASSLLVTGWVSIRNGNVRRHQYCMIAAFGASTLFLIGYLAYHYVHGDARFGGEGAIRVVYFFVLATHVLLSMFIVPLPLAAFFFAFKGSVATHRKIAKVTLPIWLYVSVTGVVIYFMLHVIWPAGPAA